MRNTEDYNQYGDLMKQAREVREQMEGIQQKLEAMRVVGESGAGLVKVTLSGRYEVKSIVVSEEGKKEPHDVLMDLIQAAFNDSSRKVETESQQLMMSLTSELQLPDGMQMPF